jgi:GWxTD domain-containing protein
MKRIRRLLYPKRPNGGWTLLAAVAILAATAAVALAVWQSPAPAQTSGESPYERWLNQDVVYIIADEERAAFQKLRTDEERQKFIEQFWQRRDPTAGTVANKFLLEHYRRIGYANERFRTATGKPGWQTDQQAHVHCLRPTG